MVLSGNFPIGALFCSTTFIFVYCDLAKGESQIILLILYSTEIFLMGPKIGKFSCLITLTLFILWLCIYFNIMINSSSPCVGFNWDESRITSGYFLPKIENLVRLMKIFQPKMMLYKMANFLSWLYIDL